MITDPKFVQRDEQPYVATRTVVAMREIGEKVPPLIPRVYAWLQQRGASPVGPLFFRYIRMDAGDRLDVEVAVPVGESLDGEGEIAAGTLPAGQYAVARYRGAYEGLPGAWSAFERWREEEGLPEQGQVKQDGQFRGTRVEHYLAGPDDSPDPDQWETELALFVGEG